MKAATLVIATVFVVLQLELPTSFALPCGCSSKQKELPARKCNENDVTYYKRVFTVDCSSETSVSKFYESVFYQYKAESKEVYLKRIDTIFDNIYKSLDCRLDTKRKQFLSNYYKYKYEKKSCENDEAYFERVLTKKSESECTYKSKIELMKTFVKTIDWSKIKIEEKTKKGFSIIKKSSTKTKDTQGCKTKSKKEEKKKETQKAKKSNDSCGCGKQKKPGNSGNKQKSCGDQNTKKQDKTSTKPQKPKKTNQQENCNNMDKIKKQKENSDRNKEKVKQQQQVHDNNVKDIQTKKESHDKNVKKIEDQQREHEKNKDKLKDQEQNHDKNVEKACEQDKEHERNLQKAKQQDEEHNKNVQEVEKKKLEHNENVKKAESQKAEHNKNVKEIEDKKEQHDENVKKVEARKIEQDNNAKKWIQKNYCKKSEEDTDAYYKRITSKSGITDEEYIKRLTLTRSVFSDLSLWTDEKYFCLIQEYYRLVYTKKTTETEEAYFKRLIVKECYESVDVWAKRINLLHKLFFSCSIWYEEKYYETFTKTFYGSYYKKGDNESNEDYLKRVFLKVEGESEENFWKRIKLIQKTFPDYKCWYEKDNLKKIDACKSVSSVSNEDELKKKVETEKESDECSKAKMECLQTFFKKSSKTSSSTTTQTSSEDEEISCTSKS